MEKIINLEITDTAYGGYGVGRTVEGQVVFVPFTVEGDIVDCEITENKKRLAYARLLRVSKPSKYRVNPACQYFAQCGGCSFGHIDYDAQQHIKERIVKNALHKYPYELPEIEFHQSEQLGYRIRANVRIEGGKAGFNKFKTNKFVSVDDCRVIKPSLFERFKVFAEMNKLFKGEVYAIETPDNVSLALIKSDIDVKPEVKGIFDGALHNKRGYGLKHVGYNTGYGTVGVGRDTFFQANRFLIDDFQTKAVSYIKQGLDVRELYAGSGFFTCGIKSEGGNVEASELSQTSVNVAKAYGYNVTEQESGAYLSNVKSADVIFLDPPREGTSDKVISNILRLKPISIVYVSCNPSTLARDLNKLSERYKIDEMSIFDMFPDTYHVEIVVKLSRI